MSIITVETLSGPASLLKESIEGVQQVGPHQLRVATKSGHIWELRFATTEQTKEAGWRLLSAEA
jgi:hypothetical protein